MNGQGEHRKALLTLPMEQQEYVDHALDPLATGMVRAASINARGDVSTQAPPQFPIQLHLMLSNAQVEGYSDVCSWQPHGRSFLIKDRKRFVDRVLPIYFKQSKFSSFQRQLNLYGFVRMAKRGDDYGAYYHEMFLRARADLAARMNRVKSLSSSERALRNEPDFYSMAGVSDAGTGDHAPPWLPPTAPPPIQMSTEPTSLAPQHQCSMPASFLSTLQNQYALPLSTLTFAYPGHAALPIASFFQGGFDPGVPARQMDASEQAQLLVPNIAGVDTQLFQSVHGFQDEKLNVPTKEANVAGNTEGHNESKMPARARPFAKPTESDESGDGMETEESSNMVNFLRDVDLGSSDDETLEG